MRQHSLGLAILIAWAAWPSGSAEAQTFPDDSEYIAFLCGDGVMTDPFQDEAGAQGPRDLIGDADFPTGLRAADDDFLYVRVRVEADPSQAGALRPFAWGILFDLDQDTSTYEILLQADGIANSLNLYQNSETTVPDDPNDPADTPAVASYPFSSHGQVVLADSTFGSTDDYFIEFAVPWSDLEPLGLAPTTPVFVWMASSSTSASLNGDFACHDGTTGTPSLSDIASVGTVTDPDVDTDGDSYSDSEEREAGSDPNDPESTPQTVPGASRLEGGGGCNTGGSGAGDLFFVLLALVAFSRRRSWGHQSKP